MPSQPTALVTGSASGIGLEIAFLLAKKGYDLYLVDIKEKELNEVKTKIEKEYPVKITTHIIDLTHNDAAGIIYHDCLNKNLNIEVLVNNAGFFFFSEVSKTDPERGAAMIRLHVHTPSILAVLFSGSMKEKRKGYILMTSSISAYKDFPGIGFYAAGKSYIKSFCRSLRYEMKYYGVNVTTLCPGATATNLYDPNIIDVEKGKKWGVMMSAEKVARAGVDGLFRNRAVVIPGFITKVMTLLSILTPTWIIYAARIKWKKYF